MANEAAKKVLSFEEQGVIIRSQLVAKTQLTPRWDLIHHCYYGSEKEKSARDLPPCDVPPCALHVARRRLLLPVSCSAFVESATQECIGAAHKSLEETDEDLEDGIIVDKLFRRRQWTCLGALPFVHVLQHCPEQPATLAILIILLLVRIS